MDLLSSFSILTFSLSLILKACSGATFTFTNNCQHTIWPGILSNAGSAALETTGFELSPATSRFLQAPTGWSGRFWGRTGCSFSGAGQGRCSTGDCGSGQVECNGAGAAPPATLAEFTLSGAGGQDFYDVSLVDGYNVPVVVSAAGGSGPCGTTGCAADLNGRCPAELRAEGGGGCRSACEAFAKPEYCCSGEFATPATCRPSVYSAMFKAACPSSYSYAYDDATSTFTCTGADYQITFCPSIPTSRKSSKESPPATPESETGSAGFTGTEIGSATLTGTETGSAALTEAESGSAGLTGTETGSAGAMLADDSWLATLATADASRSTFQSELTLIATVLIILILS